MLGPLSAVLSPPSIVPFSDGLDASSCTMYRTITLPTILSLPSLTVSVIPLYLLSLHSLTLSPLLDNGERVTQALKKVLGEDYNYDSTNTFRALYRSFNECVFIEDEGMSRRFQLFSVFCCVSHLLASLTLFGSAGDVVFYNDKTGTTKRKLEGTEFGPAPRD